MSEDDFFKWLTRKGLSEKDSKVMKGRQDSTVEALHMFSYRLQYVLCQGSEFEWCSQVITELIHMGTLIMSPSSL